MVRNSRVGSQLSGQLGVSPETSRVVAALIGADDQGAMNTAINRAGPGAMLADASPAISGALDASLQSPVPGVMAARQRIGDRAGQSFDDITAALQGSAPVRGVRGAMSEIADSTKDARATAYNAAYTTPIDYASPQGAEVERVFNAIPARIARRAVEDANEQIIWDVNRGRLPEGARQIMAQIAEDGSVSYQEMPNVLQLDYVKRAIDEIAQGNVDEFGRMNGAGRLASDMARTLRNAVSEAVPEYRAALDAGMDNSSRINAVRFGTELLSPRTTTEEALGEIAGATGPQLEAMRDGLRGQMREVFGNVNAVPSDQNIDARQAAAALRQFSSPNAQAKLEALFGEEWPGLRTQIEQAGSALGLRARVATNSLTAGRGFANDMIDDVTMPGAIQRGKPIEAVQNFIGGITGASPEAIRGMREGVRSELADLLTRQGGAPQQAISAVVQALMKNPINVNAGNATRSAVTGLGLGSIPAATNQVLDLLSRRR
jgi:hypothetical protein